MKRILALLLCIIFCLNLTACGNSKEKKLAGDWYTDADILQFSLYSDGTCEIRGEYGTGKWTVLDDGRLKLTNFYGESDTCKYELEGDTLTLTIEYESLGETRTHEITLTRK